MGVESLGKKICTRGFFCIYIEKWPCSMENPGVKNLHKGLFLYIRRKVCLGYGKSGREKFAQGPISIYTQKSGSIVWKIRESKICTRVFFYIYIEKYPCSMENGRNGTVHNDFRKKESN